MIKIKLFDTHGALLCAANTSCFDPSGRTLAAVKQYLAGDYCAWLMRGACYPAREAASFRARVSSAESFTFETVGAQQ